MDITSQTENKSNSMQRHKLKELKVWY